MIGKDDIIRQNSGDLLRVIIIMAEILQEKELTEEDYERMKYCEKVMKDTIKKQKIINRMYER